MLRALELDLMISNECGLDSPFEYWHGKNIYCKRVRKIAMEVGERRMDLGCVFLGGVENWGRYWVWTSGSLPGYHLGPLQIA